MTTVERLEELKTVDKSKRLNEIVCPSTRI